MKSALLLPPQLGVICFGVLMLTIGPDRAAAQTLPTAFGPYTQVPIGAQGECVAIADVNNDGRNDVVLGTERFGDGTNKQSILVFVQIAGGGLAEPVRYDVGAPVSSVAIGDFTGDRRNDIAAAKTEAGIRVFVQGADGRFDSFTDYPSPNSRWLCTGDFNHDGRSDLAGIGWSSSQVSLFLQTASGALNQAGPLNARYNGRNDLEAGDVNSDGWIDIIVLSGQGQGPYLHVLLQTATGFAPAIPYTAEGTAIGVGDLSGDGRSDIALSTFGNRPTSKLSLLVQQTNGTMSAGPVLDSYDLPQSLAIADVNQDGRADALVLHSIWQQLGVYFQLDSGTLDAEVLFPVSDLPSRNPHGLAVGDITGDGMPDVAIADNEGLVVLTNRLARPIRHLTDMGFAKGNIRFRLNGAPGNRYLIEMSPAGGSMWLEDPAEPPPARRFYRATAHAGGVTFNDLFRNRIPVPGAGGTVTGSNSGATKEPGELNHGGVPGGKSVWWTWTAPASGKLPPRTARLAVPPGPKDDLRLSLAPAAIKPARESPDPLPRFSAPAPCTSL